MLRMPEFQVHTPKTAAEAVKLRAELPESMYVAGGTDLLPNLKHHLHAPQHLVSLVGIPGLKGITVHEDGSIFIGAGTTLHELATSDALAARVPALPLAASLVAGPQHRRMGTIGGNVMLDTRCLFYNQSLEWRSSLGYCLKAQGDWCHVMGTPKSCVAAQSSDTVPVLTALGAAITWQTVDGDGETALDALFTKDGRFEQVHTLPHTTLVTGVRIPAPPPGHRSTYRKVRARQAVDYPQLSVAVAAAFTGDILDQLRIVIGAHLPQPKVIALDDVTGAPLTDELIARIADSAFKQVKPQTNIHGSPEWRRHMARVEVRRALTAIRG